MPATVKDAIEQVIAAGIPGIRRLSSTVFTYASSDERVTAPSFPGGGVRYARLEAGGLTSFASRTSNLPAGVSHVTEGPGGRLVGVGSGGLIVTSDDRGDTWTARSTVDTRTLSQVLHDGTRYVACGSSARISTSATGDDWQDLVTSGLSGSCSGIVYHPGAARYAVATNTNPQIHWSADLTNWTALDVGDVVAGRGAYFGGYVMLPANNGSVRVSTDCENWVGRSSGISGHQRNIFVVGSHAVSLSGNGQNGRMAWTTDGWNWFGGSAASVADADSAATCAAILPDGRVAVGSSGGIWVGAAGAAAGTFEPLFTSRRSQALAALPDRVISIPFSEAGLDAALRLLVARVHLTAEARTAGTGILGTASPAFATLPASLSLLGGDPPSSAALFTLSSLSPAALTEPLDFTITATPVPTGYHFDYSAANLINPAQWPADQAVARFDLGPDRQNMTNRGAGYLTFDTPLTFIVRPPAQEGDTPLQLARRAEDDIKRLMYALTPALQAAGMLRLSEPSARSPMARLVPGRPVEVIVEYTLTWRQRREDPAPIA